METLLRIAIPTRMPGRCFLDVLAVLEEQITHVHSVLGSSKIVSLAISVNGLDGYDFDEEVKNFKRDVDFDVYYNVRESNIGFDANYLGLFDSDADYTWVIGDDDIICDGVLLTIVRALLDNRPDYFYVGGVSEERSKDEFYATTKLSELLSHTEFRVGGIASNIFSRDCVEAFLRTASKKQWAFWPHLAILFTTMNKDYLYLAMSEKGFVEVDERKRWLVEAGQKKINTALWVVTDISQYGDNREARAVQKIVDSNIFYRVWLRVIKAAITRADSFDVKFLFKVYWR